MRDRRTKTHHTIRVQTFANLKKKKKQKKQRNISRTTTIRFFFISYIQLNINSSTSSIYFYNHLRYLLYFLIIYNCTGKAHTSKCTDLIQYWLVLHLQYSFPQNRNKINLFFSCTKSRERTNKNASRFELGVFAVRRGLSQKK